MTYKNLPKPLSSNKQVLEYTAAAKRGSQGQFVMRTDRGWTVRAAADRAGGSSYATKQEALTEAQLKVGRTKGEVFVFDKDGALIETK